MTCLGALKDEFNHFKNEVLERLAALEEAKTKGLDILINKPVEKKEQ